MNITGAIWDIDEVPVFEWVQKHFGVKYPHEPGIISGDIDYLLIVGMIIKAIVLMPAAATALEINDQFIGGAAFYKESEFGIISFRPRRSPDRRWGAIRAGWGVSIYIKIWIHFGRIDYSPFRRDIGHNRHGRAEPCGGG